MKKKTLGQLLKRRREELALTQRELASRLGVKPSHVAYLENDRRRPSLGLLSRIGDVLGLPRDEIFLLAHPEARELITASRPPVERKDAQEIWRDFARNKPLLARYQVKPRELKVLSNVHLLGRVSAPRHYLFILNAIRQAVDDE